MKSTKWKPFFIILKGLVLPETVSDMQVDLRRKERDFTPCDTKYMFDQEIW